MMRSVLAFSLFLGLFLGLFITLSASANAAPAHRAKPAAGQLRPVERATTPNQFSVPGWTDEQTQRWLQNGSAGSGKG